MCPCPHGFGNENLCNLCHSGQMMESHSPNKDIIPETKEELKEFTRNLARTKNRKIPQRRKNVKS